MRPILRSQLRVAIVFALAAPFMSPSAISIEIPDVGDSCGDSQANPAENTCTFTCKAGDVLQMHGSGGWKSEFRMTCGGASTDCTIRYATWWPFSGPRFVDHCHAVAVAVEDGVGVCEARDWSNYEVMSYGCAATGAGHTVEPPEPAVDLPGGGKRPHLSV